MALPGKGTLVLEDGSRRPLGPRLPRDVPFGYHRIDHSGGLTPLIVSPGVCHLPADLDAWGFAVQLYALRSERSWGMGDASDLLRFGRFARKQGASLVLLNPLDAVAPLTPQPTSPYSPTSRIFRNVCYLDVEAIPGFRGPTRERSEAHRFFEGASRSGRELNAGELIRRDEVFATKLLVLARLHASFSGSRRFDAFCKREGSCLARFATFCALAERHGADFRAWPAELRDVGSPAVARFARDQSARVGFFSWMQWHLDEQLARAKKAVGLLFDLPVGVDAGGADAWMYPEAFARGLSVGAPPDALGPAGQDWGIAGFSPRGLSHAGYEPFILMLRSAFRHAVGLRVDHVMGLFRLFMIPHGSPATRGAYVRYPSRALLDILALESHRAGAFVVGEDLGTVDPAHRAELGRRKVLSYRVAYFESKPPSKYPKATLAAVTTHDLATLAGIVSGTDVEERRALGVPLSESAEVGLREHVERLSGEVPGAPVEAVILGVHRQLARAPSRVRIVALEDAIASPLRPNIPGVGGPPSFCRPLALPLEGVERRPLLRRIAALMNPRARTRPRSRQKA
jgi:4-alpha-glucanotransferase